MRRPDSSFHVLAGVVALLATLASCVQVLGDFKPSGTGGSGTGGAASSSSGTMSTGGTGGTTGTGGGTGGTATCESCTTPSDCTAPANDCLAATCDNKCCGTTKFPLGTKCSTSGGNVCDTSGNCVGCVNINQCPQSSTACIDPVCSGGKCSTKDATSGTACNDSGGKTCDGAGKCAACVMDGDCSATGTACSTPACAGGMCGSNPTAKGTACTDNGGKECDGAGKCVACLMDSECMSTGTACALPACASGSCGTNPAAMGTACTDGGGKTCDGAGKCVACVMDADCAATGTACATAVCNTTTHTCGANNAAKGTACTDNSGVVCDGAGKCVSMHCSDGTKDADETGSDCGGASCTACSNGIGCSLPRDCKSLYCTSGACAACTMDAQCPAGDYCDLTTGGNCIPKKGTSSPCAGNNQCATGACANGVCCDQACTGTCQGCTLALTGQADGKCASFLPGTTAPAGQCGAVPPCGNDGKCAAGGICEQFGSTNVCGAVTCTSMAGKPGQLTPKGLCSGTGSCNGGTPANCPGNVLCASGSACLNGCGSHTVAGDANCPSGYYCDGLGLGSCVVQQSNGTACGAPDQCLSGFCADGVCCNSACNGVCNSCNLAGMPGTCGTEPDNGNNTSHPCSGGGVCCTGACLNIQSDINNCGGCGQVCPPTGTACKIERCMSATCNSVPAVTGTSCTDNGGKVCNGGGACVECNTNADCPGAQMACNASNQCVCVPQSCTAAGAACGTVSDGCGGVLNCGTCIPPQQCCGNACIDTTTSPTNCGTCGHSCLGGGCSGGACQPIPIAQGQQTPVGIAVDSTRVYWANNTGGTVMSCMIANCVGTQVPIISGQTGPWGVAVDTTRVVWTNYTSPGAVLSALVSGGGTATLSPSEPSPYGIATDGTFAYWVASGKLRKSPTTGGSVTLIGSVVGDAYVAADAAFAYTLDSSAVKKWPGGSSLAVTSGAPLGITVDATNVYWVNGSGVFRIALSGGTLTTVASGGGFNGVTVDATNIYFTDQSAGTVSKCAIAGCPSPTVIASGQPVPRKIVNDPVSLYWTNSSGGQVMRLAK